MPVFIVGWHHAGDPGRGYTRWTSFGARPIWFFNKHASVAFEAGFDHIHDGRERYAGWMRKFTIAPQLATGPTFFARPVLRLFVTYANWSDALRGYVGGDAYAGRSAGLTAGVQMEARW